MKEFDEKMKEVFGVSEVEYDSVNFVVERSFHLISSWRRFISKHLDFCC